MRLSSICSRRGLAAVLDCTVEGSAAPLNGKHREQRRLVYFGTLKIARRTLPAFTVSISEPRKTRLRPFFRIKCQPAPLVIEDELDRLMRFLDAIQQKMGPAWDDRTSLHLSSPGWQALGVIYNDLVHLLRVPDFEATAGALARVNWSRSAPIWKEIVVERTKDDGTAELVLGSAGANNRRAMIKVLREQLGIADRVQLALDEKGRKRELAA
jgi:hypothetical protein